jgi:hypothetical protein
MFGIRVSKDGKEFFGSVTINDSVTTFKASSALKIITKIQKFIKGQNL